MKKINQQIRYACILCIDFLSDDTGIKPPVTWCNHSSHWKCTAIHMEC